MDVKMQLNAACRYPAQVVTDTPERSQWKMSVCLPIIASIEMQEYNPVLLLLYNTMREQFR